MKPSDKEILECPYMKPCGLVPCVTEGKCPADKPAPTKKVGDFVPWIWPGATSDTTADPYTNYEWHVTCSNVI